MEPITIGMSQFLDFTLKHTMLSKMKKVQEIKNQGAYHPIRDHWKEFREALASCCKNQRDLRDMEVLLRDIPERKKNSYASLLDVFLKFIRNKDVTAFVPPNVHWKYSDALLVRATPEIGLTINGIPHLIKIFFKGDTVAVSKRNIQPTLTLMEDATKDCDLLAYTTLSTLDIKKGKLHTLDRKNPLVLQALRHEAQLFLQIWHEQAVFVD
ncbi:hypothetical protein [Priestia taiwanensis]|uniref:Uncharacterized protein n=1 Tax=Priestia taiwanensis TaxID=1347902 RepID=A0A917AKG3_9BACI|nr:hypothetical protein [Priestia taiwanensis]MBM7361903.1 hypothetical protein [Priestia taiwanensis]GGE57862.1 hypothetical protein GCM10007140_05310 [Priestia taiwanensis]